MLATLYDLARVRAATERTGEALELTAVILHHPARNQHALFRQATIEEEAETLRGELEGRLDPEMVADVWRRGSERELQSAVDEVLGTGFLQNGR